MVVSNEPTNEFVRELFARFGLAYYHSEVLHRGLCIIRAMSGLPRRDLVTRPMVEERLAEAFSLTLGDVIHSLVGNIPDHFARELREAVEARNFLAHRFWFERMHPMSRAAEVQRLIAELDEYRELFSSLDEQMYRWFKPRLHELGVTDDVISEATARLLSGHAEEALRGKNTVMELKKKLKHSQRLVRVWEFTLPDGLKPLIFETQEGSLWQLCDLGLGWTRFDRVQPDWIEHPAIKPYLPADIIPRPKGAKPWDYEFRLGQGAVSYTHLTLPTN